MRGLFHDYVRSYWEKGDAVHQNANVSTQGGGSLVTVPTFAYS